MKGLKLFCLFLLSLGLMSCGSKNETQDIKNQFQNPNQPLSIQAFNFANLEGHYVGETKYVDFSTYHSSIDLLPALSKTFTAFEDQSCQDINAQRFLRKNGLRWKDLDVEITEHLLIQDSKVTSKKVILSYYNSKLVGVKCNQSLRIGRIEKGYDNAYLYFNSVEGEELTYEIYKSNGEMILKSLAN